MRAFLITILMLLPAVSVAAQQTATISFDRSDVQPDFDENIVRYGDLEPTAVGQSLMLSCGHYLVALAPDEAITELRWESPETEVIGRFDVDDPLTDIPTSAADRYQSVRQPNDQDVVLGAGPVTRLGELTVQGRSYAELIIWPVTVDAFGEAILHRHIAICVGSRLVAASELIRRDEALAQDDSRPQSQVGGTAAGDAVEYVIVTGSNLTAPAWDLAAYKTSLGLATQVELIDDILSAYSGIDDAERLREYLKDFYAQGGQYVLLAGDETVLPLRYAYNFSTNIVPDLDMQQICDLYFADLTGDWDVDDDGVYGEPIVDSASIDPELRVGRLPFNTALEFQAWIDKLIEYETDPGRGDREYLNRAFFFSSDQMRDYSGGGQHGRIASAYPPEFVIDTILGVEQASGDDVSPDNALAADLVDTLGNGYGIVNVLAHGAYLLFEVRTSGYNNFPKSRFVTLPSDGIAGSIMDLPATGKTSLYYSLACDNAAFDYDQPPYNEPYPNLVQTFLAQPEAGAVAFVANTRWGWVGSSHLLQKAYFDSLFAHPELPAIDAMYASKKRYYYYRDMVYGQGFFGDPSMKVYLGVPEELAIEAQSTGSWIEVTVTSDGNPVADCNIVMSDSDGIVIEALTDNDGQALLNISTEPEDYFVIAAVKDGCSADRVVFAPGIASDVADDPETLPYQWSLSQNYPNPFNPTTTIAFDLARGGQVELCIYNVLGRLVTRLVDDYFPVGSHWISWDGQDRYGHEVASGVYFYRLATEDFVGQKKMTLLR